MKSKLEIIIREFNESCPEGHLPKMPNVDVFKFGEMKERIMEQLESYTGTPFTIQRLCELLVQPKRHYKRTDKFMRGLEKVMLVVSTVDPITTSPNIQDNGCSLLVEREKLKVGACSQVYESPSKRIRLASAEEEGGPCDSADGATTPCVSKEAPDLCSAPGPSSLPGVSLPSTSTATASSNLPMTEVMQEPELDSMDIDTECTSSEARLSIPDRQEDSVESSIEANREEEAESSPEEGVESSQGEGRREASPEGDDQYPIITFRRSLPSSFSLATLNAFLWATFSFLFSICLDTALHTILLSVRDGESGLTACALCVYVHAVQFRLLHDLCHRQVGRCSGSAGGGKGYPW